jgi:hypothetical protein
VEEARGVRLRLPQAAAAGSRPSRQEAAALSARLRSREGLRAGGRHGRGPPGDRGDAVSAGQDRA